MDKQKRKIHPNSLANLKLITKETAKEMSRKGAKAMHEAQRQKAEFAEAFKAFLSMPLPKGSPAYKELKQQFALLGITKEPTALDRIIIGIWLEAATSVQAATFIRDTIGQKPVDRVEKVETQPPIVLSLIPEEDIAQAKADKAARESENVL